MSRLEVKLCCYSSGIILIVLRKSFSLAWDSTNRLGRLAGHWDRGIHLSLTPQDWDYKHGIPDTWVFIYTDPEGLNSCPHTSKANALLIELSSQSYFKFFEKPKNILKKPLDFSYVFSNMHMLIIYNLLY